MKIESMLALNFLEMRMFTEQPKKINILEMNRAFPKLMEGLIRRDILQRSRSL